MPNESTSKLTTHTLIRGGIWLAVLIAMIWYAMGSGSNDSNSEYPNRPITLIVPFGPGGESDTFARMIQRTIAENQFLDQEVVVSENDVSAFSLGEFLLRTGATISSEVRHPEAMEDKHKGSILFMILTVTRCLFCMRH